MGAMAPVCHRLCSRAQAGRDRPQRDCRRHRQSPAEVPALSRHRTSFWRCLDLLVKVVQKPLPLSSKLLLAPLGGGLKLLQNARGPLSLAVVVGGVELGVVTFVYLPLEGELVGSVRRLGRIMADNGVVAKTVSILLQSSPRGLFPICPDPVELLRREGVIGGYLGLLRLRLVNRRHLAELEHVEDRFPRLQFLTRRQVAVELMNCEIAFALCRPVTFDAMRFEEWSNVCLEAIDTRRDRIRQCLALYRLLCGGRVDRNTKR